MKQILLQSQLHDEKTFYAAFFNDLKQSTTEIIIESPFITNVRVKQFYPIFHGCLKKGVRIYVITKLLEDVNDQLSLQAEQAINAFEELGVQPFLCKGNHHRKLAIIDRTILWEGSLNILSHTQSREIMRRMESEDAAQEMFTFLNLAKFI